MAGSRDLTYKIGVDSSQGVAGVKQFSSAVKRELKSTEDAFDETATAGERVARVLSAMAGTLDTELTQAAAAAEALSTALGPELAGRADIGQLVGDLNRMGLSFDEITTDADKLAVSLKELDDVQMRGLNSGLGNVDTSVGRVRDSADQSRSVLANMVGNSAQDIGQLAGVTGSAGVAMGQLAEYATEGNISLQGLATTAVPMAALGVAVATVAKHMKEVAETEAFNKERVEEFNVALEDTKLTAGELVDILSGPKEGVTDMFVRISDESVNVEKNVAATFGTFQEFFKLVEGGQPALDAWLESQIAAAEAEGLSTEKLYSLRKALDDARDGTLSGAGATHAQISGYEDLVYAATAAGSAVSGQGQAAVDAAFDQKFYGDTVGESVDNTEAQNRALDITNTLFQGISDHLRDAVLAGARFGAEAKRIQTALAGLDDAAVAADAFSTAWADAADSTAGAKTNLADLVDANQNLIDGFRDSEGKIRAARAELDIMSDTGRANIDAAEALRDAYGQDLAQALEDAGGKYREVRQRARFWREELEGQLEALGLNKTQIDEYVTAVGLADKDVVTTIRLSGQEAALTKIEALNIQYDELPEEVATTVRQEILKGDYKGALAEIQEYYDLNPAILPVKPVVGEYVYPPGLIPGSGGGGGGGAGLLSAGPMAAGVTPMAGPTLPTLMLPVAAPRAAGPPIVVNLYSSVNAAVVGAPMDVANAVEDGMRRTARLMPLVP